jgi:hypothetical protein
MTVAVSMVTGRTNQYAWPINAADGLLARFPSTLIVLAEMVWVAVLVLFFSSFCCGQTEMPWVCGLFGTQSSAYGCICDLKSTTIHNALRVHVVLFSTQASA